jgi:hypothetical protein
MTLRTSKALLCVAALALPLAAGAQDLGFSPDITAELGSGPSALLDDDDVGIDDGAGGVQGPVAPSLPANADVIGWHGLPGADSYLSFDITVALPGLPAPVEPRDVVFFDRSTATYAMLFDGSASGVPSNARVDAVSEDAGGDLLLSFDTTVSLPGGVVADDEDVVRLGAGIYTLVFDGSAAGVVSSTDLDGVHDVIGGPLLLVSFDTSGSVGAVVYDDEDVLAYDTGSGTFALFFDASTTDPADWPAADLVALPEPGAGSGLGAGVLLLALAGWRRR